jgi:hypothetical protein
MPSRHIAYLVKHRDFFIFLCDFRVHNLKVTKIRIIKTEEPGEYKIVHVQL